MLDSRMIVASCALDGTLKLWDMGSMRPIGEPLVEHLAWIRSITAKSGSNRRFPRRYFPLDISGIVADRYVTIRGDADAIIGYAV